MPPKTLKIEDVVDILEKKFDDLKSQLITEIRESVVEEIRKEVKQLILNQANTIEKLESDVSMLKKHVSVLKQNNENLIEMSDDNEQHGRRLCLRIEGIESRESEESSENVWQKVNDIIKETPNCDIPTWAVDRAHRIGSKTIDKDSNKKVQSIIVRFVTFRHRTMLYRARKLIVHLGKIRLDLTKRRYGILKDAINIANKSEMIEFVYADVNCRLKAHPKDFFTSVQDLKMRVADLEAKITL